MKDDLRYLHRGLLTITVGRRFMESFDAALQWNRASMMMINPRDSWGQWWSSRSLLSSDPACHVHDEDICAVSRGRRRRRSNVSVPSSTQLVIRRSYITAMFLQARRYESGQQAARGVICRKQFDWWETETDGWVESVWMTSAEK